MLQRIGRWRLKRARERFSAFNERCATLMALLLFEHRAADSYMRASRIRDAARRRLRKLEARYGNV